MDVTYGDLIGATEALQALTKRSMPIAGALAVRRLIRQVQSQLEDYHEVRKGLLDRYAQQGPRGSIMQNEKGQVVFHDDEAREAFIVAQQALQAETVTVDGWLSVDTLGTDPIAPWVLLALGPLLGEA